MSLYDYEISKQISKDDPPFAAIIMAAMRKADSDNSEILSSAYPEIWYELRARYHAPSGRLDSDPEPRERRTRDRRTRELVVSHERRTQHPNDRRSE